MSSVEKSVSSPEVGTALVHLFPNKGEMLKIKSTEINSGKNLFAIVLRKDAIELTEPCRSKMCAAPKEAHRLAKAA